MRVTLYATAVSIFAMAGFADALRIVDGNTIGNDLSDQVHHLVQTQDAIDDINKNLNEVKKEKVKKEIDGIRTGIHTLKKVKSQTAANTEDLIKIMQNRIEEKVAPADSTMAKIKNQYPSLMKYEDKTEQEVPLDAKFADVVIGYKPLDDDEIDTSVAHTP